METSSSVSQDSGVLTFFSLHTSYLTNWGSCSIPTEDIGRNCACPRTYLRSLWKKSRDKRREDPRTTEDILTSNLHSQDNSKHSLSHIQVNTKPHTNHPPSLVLSTKFSVSSFQQSYKYFSNVQPKRQGK